MATDKEQEVKPTLMGLRLHRFPSAWNEDDRLLAISRPGNSPFGRNWISVITNELGENVLETHGATSEEAVEIAQAVLRAINNHDPLIKALLMARPIVDDIASGRKTITRKQDAEYIVSRIDAALAAAQE